MIFNPQEFYWGYKQKQCYKYQAVPIPNGFVFSLMELFIGQKDDRKMMKELGLVGKLKTVNRGR